MEKPWEIPYSSMFHQLLISPLAASSDLMISLGGEMQRTWLTKCDSISLSWISIYKLNPSEPHEAIKIQSKIKQHIMPWK